MLAHPGSSHHFHRAVGYKLLALKLRLFNKFLTQFSNFNLAVAGFIPCKTAD